MAWSQKVSLLDAATATIETTNNIADSTPQDMDQLMDAERTANTIDVSLTYMYELIRNGIFPKPIKIGRSSRWSKAEVNAWIKERKAKARTTK